VGRPSSPKSRKRQLPNTIRTELEHQIERGRCVYCRRPARPDRPLTREHVIPRARGGRRKDVRIIVPACASCNHRRGCRDLIPFLLARPRRLVSFIDHLTGLSAEYVRELDPRIFAELYVAVAILNECVAYGREWRWERERLCSGRSLHRRRYAARRAVGDVSERVESLRRRDPALGGPSCLIPPRRDTSSAPELDEPVEVIASRLLSVLATVWDVSAEIVDRELARALQGTAIGGEPLVETDATEDSGENDEGGIVPLDGYRRRTQRKRLRVDRRHTRLQRAGTGVRGRAA
jgi:hypothetical protein